MGEIIGMIEYLQNKDEDELTVAEYVRIHRDEIEARDKEWCELLKNDKGHEKINALEEELDSLGDSEFDKKRAQRIGLEILKEIGPIDLGQNLEESININNKIKKRSSHPFMLLHNPTENNE